MIHCEKDVLTIEIRCSALGSGGLSVSGLRPERAAPASWRPMAAGLPISPEPEPGHQLVEARSGHGLPMLQSVMS